MDLIEKLRAPILKHMKKCWTRRPADRCAAGGRLHAVLR